MPSAPGVWKALDHAADTNPPFFYLVARLTRQLVSDDHLGYRLPSILGLLGTVSCIYFILSRRVNHLSALVGATFVLCTPLAAYAYEARPYALVLGCISGAILAWQRIDDSRLYSLVVAIALAAAVSLHYYAVLVWPAFVLAEASVWIFHRRFRVGAWAAFFIGGLPVLFFSPLLLKLRTYYGQNFWGKPGVGLVFNADNWLFGALADNFGGFWGWPLVAGLTVIFLYFNLTKKSRIERSPPQQSERKVFPIGEQTLTLVLLWLPVIAVAAAKVSHGGMTARYMLPTVLGGALALGYVIDIVPSTGRALLLALLLMNYAFSVNHYLKVNLHGSLKAPRAIATHEVEEIVAHHHELDLPIVISSGHRYLPTAYYTPAESSGRLFAIADPQGGDDVHR